MISGDFGVRKLQTINRRMFIIGAAKIIVFTGIITRLFSLQITENKKYLTLSDKNRLREWRLPPVRGEFLDYFGLQHLRELPELPQLPDLQSIELELPIEEPDSSPETTQTLN